MSTAQTSHVEAIEPENELSEPKQILSFAGSAPWWMVSTLLHVLIIALASLVSISITLTAVDDGVALRLRT